MLISELYESATRGEAAIDNPVARQCLTLRPYRSEIAFLHGFESCPEALYHADKTGILCYGTETKIFGEPRLSDGTLARVGRNEGARKMETAERKAVVGSPDLNSLTTSHIERVFLTVRQELKRFQRKGLGYSKDLETHKAAVAMFLGVYNFVRVHKTLGSTPAVAAGIEFERWSLERVVEMTADYTRQKEDAKFEVAFAEAAR